MSAIIHSEKLPDQSASLRLRAIAHVQVWLALTLLGLPAVGLNAEQLGSKGTLAITLTLPLTIKEVELRFRSDRNQAISKITDISPLHPAPQTLQRLPKPDREVWYPVVDLELNAGISGILQWQAAPKIVAINHHFLGKIEIGQPSMTVTAAQLESWENNVYCEPAVALEAFYLTARVPVINGQVHYSVRTLGEQWTGSVAMLDPVSGREIEVARYTARPPEVHDQPTTPILSAANLEHSLLESVHYLLRSQNRNPASPTHGGLHLFYDTDAQTYRSSYWIWGAGPAVSALLEAEAMPTIARHFSRQQLSGVADEIGQSSLALRIMDPAHPAYGLPISRWRRAIELPFGFEQCAAPSDALFLAGWSWIPLYQKTGNPAYLQAAQLLAQSTAKLMQDYELIPQDYYVDRQEWSEHTIDESGFGVEGLRALYQATGERKYQEQADAYMKMHLAKLARTDGLWERGWHRRTGVMPTIRMTRGLGWAMEGLLAAHAAVPLGDYLNHAKRLADQMAKWQRPDGSWVFIADQTIERHGISEKGTALWALLYYRLYHATGDSQHLAIARRALTWCILNQYRGSDSQARGGIVGLTEHSAVGAGHRAFFPITCAYTTGFLALATMEEMRIQEQNGRAK